MSWSRNTAWRQGSVLLKQDFQSLGRSDTSDADLAVVISHDCDIANENLDAEPVIEFILARIIEEVDGNCTNGKNPRTLHLQYEHEGKPVVLELVASRRVVVAKTNLEAIQPSQTYELMTSRSILQSWLAARYRRHALPNSLVERLAPVFEQMAKEGKKNSAGILSFQVDYEPRSELPPADPYELWIYMVYVTDKAEYELMARQMAQDLQAKFPQLLEKKKSFGGVDLRYCEAVSESEFTLRDMRATEEYRLEYLSYRADPPDPMV
jgi:hypothetical protein